MDTIFGLCWMRFRPLCSSGFLFLGPGEHAFRANNAEPIILLVSFKRLLRCAGLLWANLCQCCGHVGFILTFKQGCSPRPFYMQYKLIHQVSKLERFHLVFIVYPKWHAILFSMCGICPSQPQEAVNPSITGKSMGKTQRCVCVYIFDDGCHTPTFNPTGCVFSQCREAHSLRLPTMM